MTTTGVIILSAFFGIVIGVIGAILWSMRRDKKIKLTAPNITDPGILIQKTIEIKGKKEVIENERKSIENKEIENRTKAILNDAGFGKGFEQGGSRASSKDISREHERPNVLQNGSNEAVHRDSRGDREVEDRDKSTRKRVRFTPI